MKMMSNESLKDILLDAIELKGISPQRLHQATEVPERYIDLLLNEEYAKLPAAPYTRGYILKIAATLGLNGDELWELYQKETAIKSSGKHDKLPSNRFALASLKKRWLILGVIGAVLIGYLILNAGKVLGRPSLIIYTPEEATMVSAESVAFLSGKIDPDNKLRINGEEISVGKNGEFSQSYSLEEGVNTFEIVTTKLLGKETRVVKRIVYQPEAAF